MKNNIFLYSPCLGVFMILASTGMVSPAVGQTTDGSVPIAVDDASKTRHVPDSSSRVFCVDIEWGRRESNADGRQTKTNRSQSFCVSYHYSRQISGGGKKDDGLTGGRSERPEDEPKPTGSKTMAN